MVVWIAGLTVAVPAPAVVEPSPPSIPVQVTWNPAPGCPPAFVLYDDLARLSGGALVAAQAGEAEVVATTEITDNGYELLMTLRDPDVDEQRVLQAEDCATLARAAVLMTAVTLAPVSSATVQAEARASATEVVPERPTRSTDNPKPAPTDDPTETATPPNVVPTVRSIRDEAPTPPLRHRAWVAASGGLAVALTPNTTGTVGAEVGWRWKRFGLHLGGWHAFATTRELEPAVGVRASVSAASLGVRYILPAGPFELPVFGSVEVGVLAGGGAGARVREAFATSVWVAGAAGVGLAWPAQSRWAAQIGVQAVVPLARPGIHLLRDGQPSRAFESPAVALRIVAGPVVRFF